MAGLTDEESWALKKEMQKDTNNESHIGIVRAKKQAKEFCLLRKRMYNYNREECQTQAYCTPDVSGE